MVGNHNRLGWTLSFRPLSVGTWVLVAGLATLVACNRSSDTQADAGQPRVEPPRAETPKQSPSQATLPNDVLGVTSPPGELPSTTPPKPSQPPAADPPSTPQPSPALEKRPPDKPALEGQNSDRTPPAKPTLEKPAAKLPAATPKPEPRPAAATSGNQPAPETPAADPAKPADSVLVLSPDTPPEDLVRLIFDMLNERPAIRKSPGFADSVCEASDQVLASPTAIPNHKLVALRAKFKILHEAAVDGDNQAYQKLLQLAAAHREDARPEIAEYVKFIDMERQVLDALQASPDQLAKTLEDLKSYLAQARLLERHLRMAMATVDLIQRVDEKQREALYKEFGNLYAKGVDLDVANFGKRLADPAAAAATNEALAGQKFELAGTTAGGSPFKWDGYRGKVVIVDFWATWCGPCIRELPNVMKLHEQYHAHGLEIVGVSIDLQLDDLRQFLDEHPLPWVTLAGEANQKLAAKYGVRAIPTFFLIDKEGKIVARASRVEQFLPAIEAMLRVKTSPAAKKP